MTNEETSVPQYSQEQVAILAGDLKEAFEKTRLYYEYQLKDGYFYLISINKVGSIQEIVNQFPNLPFMGRVTSLIEWGKVRISLTIPSHLYVHGDKYGEDARYKDFVPLFIYMRDGELLEEVYRYYCPPEKLKRFDKMDLSNEITI